jgi:hypothetical protein
MYHQEHPPPHFHAEYGDYAACVVIDTLEVSIGRLPRRVLALVLEWALMHRPELRENWLRAERGEPLASIAPLDEEV